MEMVTERDMEDAKGIGERSGLEMMDDWDEFIHDVAQAIANGRRPAHAPSAPPLCSGCGVYPADPPGDLCPGCDAYREHQQ